MGEFDDYDLARESGGQYSVVLAAFDTDFVDTNFTRGLFVDADGPVKIKYEDGSSDTLILLGGVIHPIVGYTQILAAGTTLTAGQIHIIY